MNVWELKATLHNLIDPIWQKGYAARDTVYKYLSAWCDREDAHVSNMSEEELVFSITIMKALWALQGTPCFACSNRICDRHMFPVCRLGKEIDGNCKAFESVF